MMNAETVDSVISALEAFQGFDCREGIQRIFGNKELYCRLIALFFNAHHPDRIQNALQECDPERAVGEAHALKGAALNMGFHRIAQLSGAIEDCMKAGQTDQAAHNLALLQDVFAQAMNTAQIPPAEG